MRSANTELLSAQFEHDEAELIRKVVKLRAEDLSSFIRRSVRKELASLGYVPVEQMQALGIMKETA
ncbi:MAG: hypothetical protein ACRDF4_08180 [Rhabdochlamydiaceae bacterium]